MSARETQSSKCDYDEVSSDSIRSVAWQNDDVSNDTQTAGSRKPSQSSNSGTVRKSTKPSRKRRSKSESNVVSENSDDSETDKTYQVPQRIRSNNVTQRRSPRRFTEVREARTKYKSLELRDWFQQIGEVDVYAKLTPQEEAMCRFSLSEVNRKLRSVSWKPLD
ncbi:hypothetical protein HA402_007174 [Bradysia odoriphaga]|nr:hypothetical protein HA402_007174 [Bradysia odoriphaga]